jgi:hypothetical protein
LVLISGKEQQGKKKGKEKKEKKGREKRKEKKEKKEKREKRKEKKEKREKRKSCTTLNLPQRNSNSFSPVSAKIDGRRLCRILNEGGII